MAVADRPDNAIGMTELVAQLAETSGNAFRQVDVSRINLQNQQLNETQEEHRARHLHTECQRAL
eukprot:198681-Amphidinium_carterae.4